MIGQTFGLLTVVSTYITTARKQNFMRCVCSCACGNPKQITVRAAELKRGKTRSCGCLIRNLGKRHRLPKGESGFRCLFRSYKYGALDRGFSFSLSEDLFRVLTKSECHYCGAPPTQKKISRENSRKLGEMIEHSTYFYNGVDRVCSSSGYDPDNVVACCNRCNRWKTSADVEDFLTHINAIAKRHPR